MPTKIEWTDEVWNPITGCSKVSEGCQNCYAERISKRFWDRPFSEVKFHPKRLKKPYLWKKPRRIFVNSMGDIFHKDVPSRFLKLLWDVFADNERHTFIILTKRPRRMQEFCNDVMPYKNIWLGVTVENQERAEERIPLLLKTKAHVRFVSCEPLLSPIDLTSLFHRTFDALRGKMKGAPRGILGAPTLDWVICGAETGPKARLMFPAWARALQNQCKGAGVPFFMKKMSYRQPVPDDLKVMQFPKL